MLTCVKDPKVTTDMQRAMGKKKGKNQLIQVC